MAKNQVVTLCTVPDKALGEKIAQALVEEQLAACVNLLPGVSSTYRWEGQVETASECLLLIKTDAEHFNTLKQRIKALHSYELPEIIALPIEAGSSEYLKWISENLK